MVELVEVDVLIEIHALAGILSIFAFFLIIIEFLTPTENAIKKIKIFSLLGTFLIFVSWVVGGYYYVTYYGDDVKPAIKESSEPWIHSVGMETKEHIFLFLPFLAILVTSLIFNYDINLLKNEQAKNSVLMLCTLIILLDLTVAGMGFLISAGARAAGVGG
ncbi:MAG: hypothetical protein ACE5OZ_04165 [Candidatus Heimdallarchaeota archaeon]